MITAQSTNVLLGRGRAFFDRFTGAGNRTGFRFLGNCSKLEFKMNDEKAQIFNYAVSTAPLLDESVTKREPMCTMTLHEYTRENVALVLMGSESSYTQTSTPVVGESLAASVIKGRSYQTAKRAITGVTVKKGATSLVLGTDYDIVDAELGLIHIREGSVTVSDADAITIDYTPTAITGAGRLRVQAGTSSFIKGALLYVPDNAAGPAFDIEIWTLSLSAESAIGLITGTDYGSFDLSGKVLADTTNHPTEPYYRLTQRP